MDYMEGSVYWGIRDSNDIDSGAWLRILRVVKVTKRFIHYRIVRHQEIPNGPESVLCDLTNADELVKRKKKDPDANWVFFSQWEPSCQLLKPGMSLYFENGCIYAKETQSIDH